MLEVNFRGPAIDASSFTMTKSAFAASTFRPLRLWTIMFALESCIACAVVLSLKVRLPRKKGVLIYHHYFKTRVEKKFTNQYGVETGQAVRSLSLHSIH